MIWLRLLKSITCYKEYVKQVLNLLQSDFWIKESADAYWIEATENGKELFYVTICFSVNTYVNESARKV